MNGHEFLDAARSDTVWDRAKTAVVETVTMSTAPAWLWRGPNREALFGRPRRGQSRDTAAAPLPPILLQSNMRFFVVRHHSRRPRAVPGRASPGNPEALGGFWGYPSRQGWGNSGKDG